MKYPKLRELVEAIRALIVGPYTTKYPFEPHTPPPRYRGKPTPSEEGCVACEACANACPSGAIELVNDIDKAERTIRWRYDRCIFCRQCEVVCTTEEGVKLTQEFELACFDRGTLVSEVKKELLLCPDCKSIIGAKAHLVWLVKKLGPMAYSNFPLILTSQMQIEVPEELPKEEVPKAEGRSQIFRILCSKCRREVLLKDEHGT